MHLLDKMQPVSRKIQNVANTSGLLPPFEKNNTIQVFNTSDGNRNKKPDKVCKISVHDTFWPAITHSWHGDRTNSSNKSDSLNSHRMYFNTTRPTITSTSHDNNLPMVEQTPKNETSGSNPSINRPAEAIEGFTTQQRPQAATMLEPVSTKTLKFDVKNEKLKI